MPTLTPKSDYELYSAGRGCLGPSGVLPVVAELAAQWAHTGAAATLNGCTRTVTASTPTRLVLTVATVPPASGAYYAEDLIVCVPHAAIVAATAAADANLATFERNPQGQQPSRLIGALIYRDWSYPTPSYPIPTQDFGIGTGGLIDPPPVAAQNFNASVGLPAQYWQFRLRLQLTLTPIDPSAPATATLTIAIG